LAAVLEGLASHALARGADLPKPIRIEAARAIAGAVLHTFLRDIHGLPFLAGLAVAALWMRRDAHQAISSTHNHKEERSHLLNECFWTIHGSRSE
jgi:hypothetical protein